LKRQNLFSRFNTKGGATQPLATNIDAAVCMTASSCPPFRPRFLDRLLLQADAASIRAIIVCNKTDLAASMDSAVRAQVESRLALFERMGYDLLFVSVKTGEGLDGLKSLLEGKCAVLAGQSGCGKTSLLNALFPDAMRKTGLLNRKYGSGNHTTVMSVMFEGGGLAPHRHAWTSQLHARRHPLFGRALTDARHRALRAQMSVRTVVRARQREGLRRARGACGRTDKRRPLRKLHPHHPRIERPPRRLSARQAIFNE
jgi:hypothetical protein